MTVVDSAPVRRALERSADPRTGRAALTRLGDAHPQLRDELATESRFLDAVVAVTVASHSLLAVLERDEGAFAPFTVSPRFACQSAIDSFGYSGKRGPSPASITHAGLSVIIKCTRDGGTGSSVSMAPAFGQMPSGH